MIAGLVACQSGTTIPPTTSVLPTTVPANPTATVVPATTVPTVVPPTTMPTVVPPTSAASASTKVTIPSNLPKKKIGVFAYSFADSYGLREKSIMESLAKTFNVEFVFIEWGVTPDANLAAFEPALQTGLDGVIVAGGSVALMEATKKAGNIPLIGAAALMDDAKGKQLSAYDNFLGQITPNDYISGENSADALYAAGCRKVAAIGVTPGLSAALDARMQGFKDRVAAKYPDMKIIAQDLSLDFVKAISSFAAAYPEMDGIFTTGLNEQAYQAITNEGLVGKIKLVSYDIAQSTKDFFDNGTLVYDAGLQYNAYFDAFVVLYNYLYNGTKLIPDTSKAVTTNYIEIKNSADYQTILKVANGDLQVYTPDEIAGMIKGFNPSFTFEDFVKINEAYSVADLVARHANDLK